MGLLRRPPVAVTDDEAAVVAWELARRQVSGCVAVIDRDGRYCGVVTEADLWEALRRGAAEGVAAGEPVRVARAFHTSIPRVPPDTTPLAAMRRLREGQARTLAVVDPRGTLLGLLTPAELGEA